jgi:hypothetical protein
MRLRTTITALLAATFTLATPALPDTASSVTLGRPAAPTQETNCDEDQSGTHVGVGCGDEGEGERGGTGGNGGSGGGGGGGGGGGINPAEACSGYPGWGDCETVVALNGRHPDDMCGYMVAPDQSLLEYYHPGAPADATLVYYICPRQGLVYSEDTAWVEGGAAAPPPPTPAEVAEGVWAEVQADLAAPQIEAWPPLGTETLVNSAVFVSVTNWQGTQEERGCDGAVCVNLTATPTLTFDPGDATAIVTCEAGGTGFDLASSVEPLDQADREGACAHVYERASGIEGRPAEWPGQVTITWTASWEEEGGGDNDDFDPIPLATPLPRAVNERSTVITDYST